MKAICADQLDELKTALELLPFPMALVATDGHILQANAAMRTAYAIEGDGAGLAIWSWAPNEEERRFRQQYAADFGRLFDLSGQLSFSCIDIIQGQSVQVQVLSRALHVDGRWYGYLAFIHFPEPLEAHARIEQELYALMQAHDLSLEVTRQDGTTLFSSRIPEHRQTGWIDELNRDLAGSNAPSTGRRPAPPSAPAGHQRPVIRLSRNNPEAPISEPMAAIMEKIYRTVETRNPPAESLLLIDASLHIRETIQASLGYSHHTLPGKPVLDFVASEFYREDLRIKLDYAFSAVSAVHARIPVFDAFGNVIWYQTLLSPALVDGVLHVLATGHDITRQLQAEELMRESEALIAKSQLASLVAHELNNPLAGIKNAFEILKLDCICCPVEQRAAPYFALIDDEINRMRLIIRQLYGLYNPTDEPSSAVSPLDIAERALTLLQADCRRKNLHLAIHSPLAHTQQMLLPRNLLEQCLVNVLKNAIDYSPEHGEISLFINYKQEQVTFSIIDQGPGIDESAPLFEPFFSNRTAGQANLGLGLAVTKSLITKAGGTIQASNRSAGGALFNLSLPARPATD